MVSIYKEIEVAVTEDNVKDGILRDDVYIDIDLDQEIDIHDLIDAVEYSGYTVSLNEEEMVLDIENIESLRSDFILWKDGSMTNEAFEKIMKRFFLDTLDDYIV